MLVKKFLKSGKPLTLSKPKFLSTMSPFGMGQVVLLAQAICFTPSHWLITKASLPYMNQDKYFNQTNHSGTDLKIK